MARRIGVFIADHGEAFGEHGESFHGLFVYEPTMRIPWIVAGPGVRRGRVEESVVSQVDVLPTVLGRLGLPAPAARDGVDLSAALAGRGPVPERPGVVLESLVPQLDFGWAPLFALVDTDWKFILAPRPELYQLTEDPGESSNRLAAEPERSDALRAILGRHLSEAAEGAADAAVRVSADTLDTLQSLGYLSAGTATADNTGGLADPKDRVEVYRALQQTPALIRAGDLAGAMRAYREALTLDPDNGYARYHLARLYLDAGRDAEAATEFRRLHDRSPDSCAALGGLAEAVERLQPDAALDAYEDAVACDPRVPGLWARMARLRREQGDDTGAAENLSRAIALDPLAVEHRRELAALHQSAGRPGAATALWLELLTTAPSSATARVELGRLELDAGRPIRAVDWFERALRVDPAAPLAHANLGRIRLAQGDDATALAHLMAARAAGLDASAIAPDLVLAATRNGDLDAALRVVTEQPTSVGPTVRQELASALERAGRREDARVLRQGSTTRPTPDSPP